VVADLDFMGLASSADVDNLVAYAQAVIEHQRASMLVAKQGVVVFGERGQQVRNPACVVTQQASATMLRLAREFGLTPAARTAMGTKHKPLKEEQAARLLA
jgi:P27 family predicted phage terminase small subunit